MRRLASLTLAWMLALLLAAPAALALSDHGEGTYGRTDDKVITNAGFILIAAFPLIIATLSLIQWLLDRRKEAHKAAVKARSGRPQWRGGW